MGVFSFIESFFFLSLGITFVLIFLMVFHFKQRVEQLEKKSENMLELCNGLVQQIHGLKTLCISNPPPFCPRPPLSENITFSTSRPIPIPDSSPFQKIVVPPDFNEDDESQADFEGEEDSEDSEDSEDEDFEVQEVPMEVSLELESEELSLELESEELVSETVGEEFRGDLSEVKEVDLLEEVQEVELKEPEIEVQEPVVEVQEKDVDVEAKEVEAEPEKEVEVKEIELLAEPKEQEVEPKEQEAEPKEQEVEPKEQEVESKESEVGDFKNMSVQQLKTLVISKGLSANPSKMKRPELLRLLQQNSAVPPEKTLRDLALLI